MKNSKYYLLLLITFVAHTLSAQKVDFHATQHQKRQISPLKQFDFQLESNEPLTIFETGLLGNMIKLPDPDGRSVTFTLKENKLFEPGLAQKYPFIKNYTIQSNEGHTGVLTIGRKGLHAMIFKGDQAYYIDPISPDKRLSYQSYYRRDLDWKNYNHGFEEGAPEAADAELFERIQNKVESGMASRPNSGSELRNYRIAIAATGEYTTFHGGTKADALEAIAVTLARVNVIYQREIAVSFTLVNNNELIIYTNANTDPFTNGSASAYIDEVQADIDTKIGTSNYDIGHGFSTGAGGLASLGSVCNSTRKASGVTGTTNPIGDPFDVDYVSHEIGHQFGAPHTFNSVTGSCGGGNRSSASAYEPGSGVTIMAYAGICGSDNIANNSIPYFHAASLEYMTTFSQEAGGASCGTLSTTGNAIPLVNAGTGGFTIPINTPFELTASASDADGDVLSYSWEQFDLGPGGSPNSPSGTAPLFRSYPPSSDSIRVFPKLTDLINGTSTFGELLPSYSREMNFVVTVRDDNTIAGVSKDFITFDVSDVGGPFKVNTIEGNFEGNTTHMITWNVAGTNQAPISCSNVDILLSVDGGLTYEYALAQNTANDGTEMITWPNIGAAQAKVKIKAADNIFFNLSGGTFSLTEATTPRFYITTEADKAVYCTVDNIVININTTSFLGYNEPISLSVDGLTTGFNASFQDVTINPGQSTQLTIENPNLQTADLAFNILANTSNQSESIPQTITVVDIPTTPTITAPAPNAVNVSTNPTIFWTDGNSVATYDLYIFTNASFEVVHEQAFDLNSKSYRVQNQLNGNDDYYIQLVAKNDCGISDTASASFVTAVNACSAVAAMDLPITISNEINTITSTIEITEEGSIEEMAITNLKGNHTYVSDLTFTLVSPDGTRVTLLTEACGTTDNFNLSFADTASISTPSCPMNKGEFVKPLQSFDNLIGKSITGIWTLEVNDGFAQDGGDLQQWNLSYCVSRSGTLPSAPSNLNYSYLGNGELALSWTDNADNENEFVVERTTNGQNYQTIATLQADETNVNTTLPNNTNEFTYRVAAVNGTGRAYSNTITTSISILENIVAPSDLSAIYTEGTMISLSWNDNSNNEQRFIIEAKLATEETFSIVGEIGRDTATYDYELPSVSNIYDIRVYAQNELKDSEPSNVISTSVAILDLEEKLHEKISLYPNPVKAYLMINNPTALEIKEMVLFDLQGKILFTEKNVSNEIDLSQQKAGLYLLKLTTNRLSKTFKIIKE